MTDDELFAAVLAAYLDGLDPVVIEDRLAAWAKSDGLAVRRRDGIVTVYRGSRAVAWFYPAGARRTAGPRRLPTKRCWTCGARPVGAFGDGTPRYDCHVKDPARHVPTTSTVSLWRAES